jgi:hypothetical protein
VGCTHELVAVVPQQNNPPPPLFWLYYSTLHHYPPRHRSLTLRLRQSSKVKQLARLFLPVPNVLPSAKHNVRKFRVRRQERRCACMSMWRPLWARGSPACCAVADPEGPAGSPVAPMADSGKKKSDSKSASDAFNFDATGQFVRRRSQSWPLSLTLSPQVWSARRRRLGSSTNLRMLARPLLWPSSRRRRSKWNSSQRARSMTQTASSTKCSWSPRRATRIGKPWITGPSTNGSGLTTRYVCALT